MTNTTIPEPTAHTPPGSPDVDLISWLQDRPTDGTSLRKSDTSIVLRWLGLLFIRLIGWRVVGQVPNVDKFVVIAAPHTSTLDGLILLATLWTFQVRGRWVVKAEWVDSPIGWLLKWLGAVPIDRRQSRNFVDQTVAFFEAHERAVLVIAPEGTRKKTHYWKSGFYHIAAGADVPLLLAYCDYGHKRVGVGSLLYPSGDINADMDVLQQFYGQMSGRYPEKVSDVRLRAASPHEE